MRCEVTKNIIIDIVLSLPNTIAYLNEGAIVLHCRVTYYLTLNFQN